MVLALDWRCSQRPHRLTRGLEMGLERGASVQLVYRCGLGYNRVLSQFIFIGLTTIKAWILGITHNIVILKLIDSRQKPLTYMKLSIGQASLVHVERWIFDGKEGHHRKLLRATNNGKFIDGPHHLYF